MRVRVCEYCGLIQSSPTALYVSRPPGNLSSDADRSSHRYTKTLTNPGYEAFIRSINWSDSPRILDVGSNRGIFAESILKLVPGGQVVCIEPDPLMDADVYRRQEVILLRRRFEETHLEPDSFDFIFCAHTLEHSYSASAMLLEFRKLLRPGGSLFLAVPNTLLYADVIEELFIDPHTFHFSFEVLSNFALGAGFEISLSSAPSDHEIRLLLTKASTLPTRPEISRSSIFDLEQYSNTLRSNREALQDGCRSLEQQAHHRGLVVWGAGRILDALLAGGSLNRNVIKGLVDSHLHQISPEIHGLPVTSPDSIPSEWLEKTLLVASRDYSEEITLQAQELGFKNIVTYLDVWSGAV